MTEVQEMNVGESGSGQSGYSEDFMTDLRPTVTYNFPSDELGQLYAYRISKSAVLLRTRETFADGQRIPIGIRNVASGTYTCVARNANANTETVTSIEVSGKD